PVTLVLPAMMGRSTYGAGGTAYTVAGSENGPITPATVCAACTTCPVASGIDSVRDHVPLVATVAVPAAMLSITTVATPAATPAPVTCVAVATSGTFRVGAGGGPTTMMLLENALVTLATVWRALTTLPSCNGVPLRLHVPLAATVVVPALAPLITTSTVPPAVAVPPTLVLSD